MCGIAAIYAYNYPALDVDLDELRTIRDYMRARGPDGSGEWISENRRAGLAHRRLAIIDLDERAAQPMVSSDGRYVISYNGEIYNFRELREELRNKGRDFRTQSDTEVLLQLFDEKQEAMLQDLRGMFALVIWDTLRQRLFMARDPYGIKPLYYADDGWTLRAASQVKALLAGGKISTDPEPAGIVGFHLLGSVPEPFTLYQQIQALPAGHYLYADELGAGKPVPYFSIASVYADAEASKEQFNPQQLQSEVRVALLESVRYHLVSDVPVGAFLSAGIDSGALVGLMRDAGQQEIRTITLGFEEFKGAHEDEVPLAEQVAKQYGTAHQTHWVGQAEFEQDLPAILDAMDQPSIDGINTWFVSKAAAEQGLKVAVSGLGGDELFGGYPSFKDIPRWTRRYGWLSRVPSLGKACRAVLTPILKHSSLSPKAAGMLEFGGHTAGAWLLRRGLFMPWELKQVLDEELIAQGLECLQPMAMLKNVLRPTPQSSFAQIATLESSLYMRNQLLRDADWAGMAHSLEIRVPLVDAGLLKACAPLAVQSGQVWTKGLLANAPTQAIPIEIAQRAKSGFTTPIGQWMQNQPTPKAHVRAPGANTLHWSRAWSRQLITGMASLKKNAA